MKELPNMTIKQQVTVTIKVKSISTPQKVTSKDDGRDFQKQDCIVGDISGCGKVVLWEKDIGSMAEGNSYKLAGASIKSFGGITYLSIGDNCTITQVDDIGHDTVPPCHSAVL